MAIYNQNKGTHKVYGTTDKEMMEDAIEYASRDIKIVLKVIEALEIKVEVQDTHKALVLIKFDQIKESRLNRDTTTDKLNTNVEDYLKSI